MTDDTCSIYIAKNEACTAIDICRNCDPSGKCFAVQNYTTVSHAVMSENLLFAYDIVSFTSVNMAVLLVNRR